MVKKARAAGSFIGGILGNPFLVLGGIVLGALILFRKDITGAFASLGTGISEGIGDINIQLPEIKFPEITFPEIKFPEFPDFTDIFSGFQEQIKDLSGQVFELQGKLGMFAEGTTQDPSGVIEGAPPTINLDVSPSQISPTSEIAFNQLRSQVFDTLTQTLGLTSSEAFAALRDVSFEDGLKGLDAVLQSFNRPFTPPIQPEPNAVNPQFLVSNLLGTDQEFTGGGQGFTFGQINPTPITTLTQVIDLFPGITASQAADFLSEFKGILPEAALLQGGDVINISGDPNQPQVFNQSSLGISGTPEQLFKLLFPNIISNF